MKIAYFDCQFGASGDMLLGALFAAGLSFPEWQQELAKLGLPASEFATELESVVRCSITCKKFTVRINDSEHDPGHLHFHDQAQHARVLLEDEHEHHHTHGHDHPHSDEHTHDQEHTHNHEHTHSGVMRERNLQEILQLIEQSKIRSTAKDLALQIFNRLGQAEAEVHGVPAAEIHFHEVGSIDSIVDIVGFAVGYDLLQIEKSFCSPLPLGAGTVKTRHGVLPVPAPATVLVLSKSQASISGKSFNHECLTPTGAAILATISDGWCMPEMERIVAVGYGAGSYNPKEFPNACRVLLGYSEKFVPRVNGNRNAQNSEAPSFNSDLISVLEANLDDLSPQSIAFAMDCLFEAGALDVFVLPAVMKKGRSGHLLTVLCKPGDRAKLELIILTQTSSLGVRSYLAERSVAEREWQEVTLSDGGVIRIKIARDLNGKVINTQPEYDDCAAYATATGIPLKEVIVQALTNLKVIRRSQPE